MVDKIAQLNTGVMDVLMQNKLLTLLVVALGAYLLSHWLRQPEPFESVQRAHGKRTGERYPTQSAQHRNFQDLYRGASGEADDPAHMPHHLQVPQPPPSRPARPPAPAPEDLPPLDPQDPQPVEEYDYEDEEDFGVEMYGQSITNIGGGRRQPTPYAMDKNQYLTLA